SRDRDPHLRNHVVVPVEDAPHAPRRTEIRGHHPHRNAGPAVLAYRTVGDRLTPAETAMSEDVVELGRAFSDQVRENLALLRAGQIGTRRGSREIELRGVARMLSHRCLPRATWKSDAGLRPGRGC